MTDEEIIARLREEAPQKTAVQLAELLDRLTGEGLSQAAIIFYFHRAFPATPLRILLDAGSWYRVSAGTMSDEAFNDLFRPWVGVGGPEQ